MIFKKLTIQNIRSYENLTIKFPKGSVLLAGDIGAGKTSILLGLQFALFGLQPGQRGISILKQGTENAYACLDIEIDDKTITLERTIKKSKNGNITQDSNIITINEERKEISTSEISPCRITMFMGFTSFPLKLLMEITNNNRSKNGEKFGNLRYSS